MKKHWHLQTAGEEKIKDLQKALGIRPIYCQLLIHRAIDTYQKAKSFFRPSKELLHDPSQMKDMSKAIKRVKKAVNRKEKTLIYGDYDVDGTTAIATVLSFFREQFPGIQTDFYIPDRYQEGYGLSKKGVDYARANQYDLMLVLDCGIKANKQVAYAQSSGIDVIIGDHHLPGEELPPAYAILNPKQKSDPYPYKELSGCGIGYKLICALAAFFDFPQETAEKYLDLVAVSIAADLVPVTNENRVLATLGLEKLNKYPLPGLKALAQISGLKNTINIRDVAFMIAPRINAAGRLKDADKAVELFIEKDFTVALKKAQQLHKLNDQRKKLDERITKEIIQRITADSDLRERKTTVIAGKEWPKGVIGIVASRVMETFYRPTIVLSKTHGELTGSARSVKGYNIYKALQNCAPLMTRFGGHQFAAGITLEERNLAPFIRKFEETVSSTIPENALIPQIKIDAEITFPALHDRFYQVIEQFGPFGPGNEQPVFLLKNIRDNGYSKIINNKHIRFEINHEDFPGQTFAGIGFNLSGKFDILASGKPFDVCFHLEKNEFSGRSTLQLKVLDLKLSDNNY